MRGEREAKEGDNILPVFVNIGTGCLLYLLFHVAVFVALLACIFPFSVP